MNYSLGSSTGSFAKGTRSLFSPDRPCVRGERGDRRTVCLASPPRKYKPRGLQATLEHALPPREFALLSSADVPAGPAVPDGARRSRASMATAATTGAVRSSVQLSAANAVLCIDFSSVKPQHMVCGLPWLAAASPAVRLRAPPLCACRSAPCGAGTRATWRAIPCAPKAPPALWALFWCAHAACAPAHPGLRDCRPACAVPSKSPCAADTRARVAG